MRVLVLFAVAQPLLAITAASRRVKREASENRGSTNAAKQIRTGATLNPMELSPQQMAILQRLRLAGFEIVAFPMYANYVGTRKGNCAALLSQAAGGFSIFSAPAYLIGGNFSVRVRRDGREFFVWKKESVEVTAARLTELDAFAAELTEALLPQF
jgi:hypothetical protein